MQNLIRKCLMAFAALLCTLTLSATDIESLKSYIPMDATLILQIKDLGKLYQSKVLSELAKTQGVDLKAELAKSNWKEEDYQGVYALGWAYLTGIAPNVELEICTITIGTPALIDKAFSVSKTELGKYQQVQDGKIVIDNTKVENCDAISFGFDGKKDGVIINGVIIKAAPDMIQTMFNFSSKGKAYSALLKPAKAPSNLSGKLLKNCNVCIAADCHRLFKGIGIDLNAEEAIRGNDPQKQTPAQPNYKKEIQTVAIGFDEANANLNILGQLCFLTGSTADQFADFLNQTKIAVMEQPVSGEFVKATSVKSDMNNVNLTFSMPIDKIVGLMVGLIPSKNEPQVLCVETEGQTAAPAAAPKAAETTAAPQK